MITDSDHRRVLGALRHLHEPPGDTAFGTRALRAAREVVDCDVASINEVDPTVPRFAYATLPADYPNPPHAAGVLAEHALEHPLVRYVHDTGDGSARRITDVVTSEEFRRTALYRLLYAGLGVEHQLAVTLDLPLPTVVAVVLSRGHDFTDDERDRLELLRPHLRAGWLQSQELSRLTALLAGPQPGDGDSLAARGLSPREIEIVGLLATGASNRAIGDHLGVAPGTVKKHLDSVYAKLGVSGRVQAVTLALELAPRRRG